MCLGICTLITADRSEQGAYEISIKFWLNINEKLFKVEYLIKLSQSISSVEMISSLWKATKINQLENFKRNL